MCTLVQIADVQQHQNSFITFDAIEDELRAAAANVR